MDITYDELRTRQQAERDAFPLNAAFTNAQFKEMMEGWGLTEADTDKIVSLGYGCFCLKSDVPKYKEMCKQHRAEFATAIKEDTTGEGFIYQAFLTELNNHEYGYTMDTDDAVHSLGFSYDEIRESKALTNGFEKAKAQILSKE